MKLLSSCLILAGALILASCGPDPEPVRTPAELLTAGPWKHSSAQGRLSTTAPWQDLPITLGTTVVDRNVCSEDNAITYNLDGTILVNNGELRCNELEDATTSGTWSLTNADTMFTTEFIGSVATSSKVVKLTKDEFRTEITIAGIQVQLTYVH